MNINFKTYTLIIFLGILISSFSVVLAAIKVDPSADTESLSYVFYLYYDNGKIFADRDFQINYDILNESFSPEIISGAIYKGEILNFKLQQVKSWQFDPKKGNNSFTTGKISIKAPYAADGSRAVFYDPEGRQILTIFVNSSAICDNNDFCNEGSGENLKNCPSDCKAARPTPSAIPTDLPLEEEGFDYMTIVTYVVGTLGVGVLAWFGWRWWKKKKEESFTPPSLPSSPPPPPVPPSPLP